MDETYERRLQQKTNSSFLVVVPTPLVNHLGIRKGQSLRFHSLPGKMMMIITPSGKDLTKKDLTDLERAEKIFDEATKKDRKDGGEKEEEKTEPETHPKISMLEKLRVK